MNAMQRIEELRTHAKVSMQTASTKEYRAYWSGKIIAFNQALNALRRDAE